MAETQTDYFQQYYKKNRGKINASRKERYHTDPEYRDRVLSASRKYRDKNRVSPRVRIPRHQTPLEVELPSGETIKLYSVGAFAVFLGRSVQSINHWEREKDGRKGVLPKTPYRDERGFRFYTEAMMRVVKEAIGGKRRLFPVDHLRGKIEAEWERLGVPLGAKDLTDALARTVVPDDDIEDVAV